MGVSTVASFFSDIKREELEKRREALVEEYQAANAQLSHVLSDVDRLRIQRQVADLEQRIQQVESELSQPELLSTPSAIPVGKPVSPSDIATYESGSSRRLSVFLCHSTDDKPAVRPLYHRLCEDGFDPWLDEEKLLPGQEWATEIRKAVRSSDVVIVCLSHESTTKAGYVQKEIKYALDVADEQPEGSIFLIPVRLEKCQVPERLRHVQWVNLFQRKGYEKLASALRLRAKRIGVTTKTSPQAITPAKSESVIPPAPKVSQSPSSHQATLRYQSPMDQTWRLPDLARIFERSSEITRTREEILEKSRVIEETLEQFGAPVTVAEVRIGPRITQFGVEPGFVTRSGGRHQKVKVSQINKLADDLQLALAAIRLHIEPPVSGSSIVGIQIPNMKTSFVTLRDVIESEEFAKFGFPLPLALGKEILGQPVIADLTAMPHLLIAGTTGSGKSVCIHAILACLLSFNSPDQLRLLLVDPNRVELTRYNGIPHLLAKVIIETERVSSALQWTLREIDNRYHRFSEVDAIHIHDYNERVAPRLREKSLPYIVVVIDGLADLMMMAPLETERAISQLAQQGRTTGVHLIATAQRPSSDVVTGEIKSNFPARISFAMTSATDSRLILDQAGAEQLFRGEMLFLPSDAPKASKPLRIQGTFVSAEELRRLVQHWKGQASSKTVPVRKQVQRPLWEEVRRREQVWEDELLPNAINLLLQEKRASISLLQRKLRIGYTRASQLIEILEENGVVGPQAPDEKALKVFQSAARALLNNPQGVIEPKDELLQKAIALVRDNRSASASLLQRKLRIGYPRAARLLRVMEEMGIIGPSEAAGRSHHVLMD
jgi:DNA segregation ATPase FtsK/SpoIIIE-like protein